MKSDGEGAMEHDEGSSLKISKSNFKSRRHSNRKLNNLKPCKSRKPTDSYVQFITERDEELDAITLSAQTLNILEGVMDVVLCQTSTMSCTFENHA